MARSPLHDLHARLGARFTDFGGWEMPVQYESVLSEHRAVRSSAGWFDVSHLGRFQFDGDGATSAVRGLLCNDIARIEPGRTQYTMMLNDRGGVVDDLIVWRWGDENYWILPNAANHERVMAAFASAAPSVHLEDLRPSTVTLAVQGPDAPGIIEQVLGFAPRRFRTASGEFGGDRVWTAGTGYTGERGGEIVVPVETAAALAEALVAAGATPCGLGARDTLRLEAGLPLWGQDLDQDTTPLEAGLDFAVAMDHEFPGRGALVGQMEQGLSKRLVSFSVPGRKIPRHGQALRIASSTGEVTSGNFSPMLEHGIGLGYVAPPSDGSPEVEIRGEWIQTELADLPFYRRS